MEKLKIQKENTKSLSAEFNKALKKEEFKQLIEKLNISKEILMKYTSLLEESSTEYNNCLKCKNILNCKNKIEGYAYLPKTNGKILEFSYRPCKLKKNIDKKRKYQKNITLYNVSEEFKEASFKDIYKDDKNRYDVILWITEFEKKYKKDKNTKGLYLYGNFGCGKSYLVAAMFNELAKKNIKSSIVFWPEFLRSLKASFEYKNEFDKKFTAVKNSPLLLIDDIGAEAVTPWARDEILCPLLQYRMDQKLPTFITSNLDLKSLETHLSFSKNGTEEIKAGRIISRIKQLTEEKQMISKNLRK